MGKCKRCKNNEAKAFCNDCISLSYDIASDLEKLIWDEVPEIMQNKNYNVDHFLNYIKYQIEVIKNKQPKLEKNGHVLEFWKFHKEMGCSCCD